MNYNALKDEIKNKGLTIKEFASKIGLSEAGFFRQIKQNSMRIKDLEAAAVVLETVPSKFLESDYLKIEEPESNYKHKVLSEFGKNENLPKKPPKNMLTALNIINNLLNKISDLKKDISYQSELLDLYRKK